MEAKFFVFIQATLSGTYLNFIICISAVFHPAIRFATTARNLSYRNHFKETQLTCVIQISTSDHAKVHVFIFIL